MSIQLLLPWFPIVLAVGVGSRLLNTRRSLGFGLVGTAFWIAIVVTGSGPQVFTDLWTVLSLLSGSLAIVAIGLWSGGDAWLEARSTSPSGESPVSTWSSLHPALRTVLVRFDDWLEAHRNLTDPWPDFAEFVRSAMFDLTGATHVRMYRVLSEGDVLIPLRAIELGDTRDFISARRGIIGHVVTSGRSFMVGDTAHGALIDALAEESGQEVAWCFAIREGGRRIGLVKTGVLPEGTCRDKGLLEVVEGLVSQFWVTLTEVCRGRAAENRDPITGLLSRDSFLRETETILHDAYNHGEPVAIAIVTLEGLRGLSDRGQWELADALVRQAVDALQHRLRSDDRLGRFDDSRFVVLLRRVDSALATLIVHQLLNTLSGLEGPDGRWASEMTVRCGVSGSGTEQPSLAELLARAIAQCHQARRNVVPIASDLPTSDDGGESGAGGPTWTLAASVGARV